MISVNGIAKKTLAVLAILAWVQLSVAQNGCDLSLAAENNRTIKTIANSGYTYTLYIENQSQVTHNINLSAYNHNIGCDNPEQLQMESTASLSMLLLDENLNIINNSFQINPGQKIKFYLKLAVPENTPFETWNCTEVLAESLNCDPVTLELYTFNPNPENLE